MMSKEPKNAPDQQRPSDQAGAAGDPRAQPGTDGERSAPPRRGYVRKLAHELKSPLSAIVAAAEVIRDERLGPIGHDRYRDYIVDIHDSASHMLELLNRVLAQRSAEPVAGQMDFTNVDLGALVSSTASAMQPLAKRAGVHLAIDLSGADASGLPAVVADQTSLRQILLNLVTNALKFTPDGGHVSIAVERTDDQALALVVKDDGVGMSPDELKAVQENAGQSQSGVRDETGQGIGLPLVHMLATANEASVSISSSPGNGTVVRIAFPKSRLVLG